jgi:hypothetical protein
MKGGDHFGDSFWTLFREVIINEDGEMDSFDLFDTKSLPPNSLSSLSSFFLPLSFSLSIREEKE